MTNWPVVPLRDVAEISAGITLGRKTKESELVSVPYLRVANVQDGSLDLSEIKTVQATRREIEKWRLRDGDLLLTEGGDLDKLGRGTCWREQLPLCIHQNHIFRVRFPVDRYDPDFVSLQIGSGYGKAYFFAHAKKTTGIASINQQVLGSFPLLSPPLEEQQRIAAHLKSQLAVVEEARQAAQAQVDEAAQITIAILRSTFGELGGIPSEQISRIARTCSGTTPSRSHADYWVPAVYPWIKTGEVANAPIRKSEEAISELALKECSLTVLPPGTVLVAMYGQGRTRGQSAVLEVAATTNQACFAILPSDRHEPEYLQFWLRHSYQELRSLSEGRGGNQANLNGQMLSTFGIPLPDLSRQRLIASRLKAAIAEVEAMQIGLVAQQQAIHELPARLLAQVFSSHDHIQNQG
ncbi:restriction endonuclease subunit S [Sphaerotilus sp.]|uniref:restriction endonuclease subunit S n=1 Tax=Sphaerotilus sp. TaxID=2093942 RepID=UPI00286DBC71|nr:restriction endonuclease subunit S [Sphaerotilus sp.]